MESPQGPTLASTRSHTLAIDGRLTPSPVTNSTTSSEAQPRHPQPPRHLGPPAPPMDALPILALDQFCLVRPDSGSDSDKVSSICSYCIRGAGQGCKPTGGLIKLRNSRIGEGKKGMGKNKILFPSTFPSAEQPHLLRGHNSCTLNSLLLSALNHRGEFSNTPPPPTSYLSSNYQNGDQSTIT
ncbi:hypothetical protein L211DRAFT_866441 [Terfezia boudieri ATCC MYA-4762]|uniref:Uncharacterized protein n=1 Tax=Terfezia boudieri ATCC MYA-4762 TaxID=1051890 RepID=A0A3N4LUM5_9PEZI|nr:hypothetical protein L211DRAFT_866441 [Terfezia boudieri ATCC MYA-4762]